MANLFSKIIAIDITSCRTLGRIFKLKKLLWKTIINNMFEKSQFKGKF